MSNNVNVMDIAKYVLRLTGKISAMKMQKLVYYCHAWSLVWDGKPLFRDRIEAWANGPVVPRLYRAHRGTFEVDIKNVSGDSRKLNLEQKETIEAVIKHYGGRPPHLLSALTHRERPWSDARAGLAPGERGHNQITDESMAEYYESLL